MANLEVKHDIEDDRDAEKGEGDERKNIDFAAHRFQVDEQFLLLKGIAVGGFADGLQVIFDALEGGIMLQDLVSKSALLNAQIGQAFLQGHDVDCGLRESFWRLRSEHVGDGSIDVSVEEGQHPLHEGQCNAEDTGSALHSGAGLTWRRRQFASRDRGGGWRRS